MGLEIKAQARTGDYELPTAEPKIGIVYRVVDMGTQKKEWEGEVKNVKQVALFFEFPHDLTKDGRPKVMSAIYTANLGDRSKLRPIVRDLTQSDVPANINGFDLVSLLGKSGVIDIAHTTDKNGKVRAKIVNISKVMKGTAVPDPHNELQFFDISKERYTDDMFEKLPKWYQEKITESPEYQDLMKELGKNNQEPTSEDIPF